MVQKDAGVAIEFVDEIYPHIELHLENDNEYIHLIN